MESMKKVLAEVRKTEAQINENADLLANLAVAFIATPIALDYCEDGIRSVKKLATKYKNHKMKKEMKKIHDQNKIIQSILSDEMSFKDGELTDSAKKKLNNEIKKELSDDEYAELTKLIK